MNQPAPITASRIRQEHAELIELERQLLKSLAERNQPPDRVVALFESIYQRATAHLEDEVRGFLHEAAKTDPQLLRECDALCGEHPALRTELDEVLARTQTSPGSPEWWALLERQFRSLSIHLDRHERGEQQLLDHIEGSNPEPCTPKEP